MYASQLPYRELRDAVLDDAGPNLFDAVLRPWLDKNSRERDWLIGFCASTVDQWPALTGEDLCRLYAVSRLNDVLLLRFQTPLDGSAVPPLSLDEYLKFTAALGFRVMNQARFEPFFHELVSVDPSDDPSAAIELVEQQWPCLMLGDLLFSRAGCRVRAGAHHVDPQLASRSRLHWAHRRRNRPVSDLSVGWGGNSQWRTQFRRDYLRGSSLHFNVDGRLEATEPDPGRSPNPAREELEPAERVELLIHRCFVRTRKEDSELWPWDDRHLGSLGQSSEASPRAGD